MKATFRGVIYKLFPTDVYTKHRRRKFWLKEINVPSGRISNTWEMEVQHDLCEFIEQFTDTTREIICSVEIRGKMYGVNGEDRVKNVVVCYDIKFSE